MWERKLDCKPFLTWRFLQIVDVDDFVVRWKSNRHGMVIFDADNEIRLQGVSLSSLTEENCIFA